LADTGSSSKPSSLTPSIDSWNLRKHLNSEKPLKVEDGSSKAGLELF